MKRWDVFLAAGIRQPGCKERNEGLVRVAELAGLAVFSPARESLPELSLTPLQILTQNRSAILSAPIFLFVPDGAGVGVFYELGLAEEAGKVLVGYSESGVKGLGKVIEGWWDALPNNRRATNHASLESILIDLRDSHQSATI
jgi:hypothetical protein